VPRALPQLVVLGFARQPLDAEIGVERRHHIAGQPKH
jgi:hypothetical protein